MSHNEIGSMLKMLQDPLGLPSYPIIFQVLLILTFAIHILFVNLTLGTLSVSIFGYINKGDHWLRLSKSMAKAATANVSIAIVTGVAPLLFLQVVYDPFWYSSNLLSASWVVGFIFVMMAGYGLTYAYYLRQGKGKNVVIFGFFGLGLFFLAGSIFHALTMQALLPEEWTKWYFKGNSVDTSGLTLHAFQIPRFLHFIIPSFSMAGIFLMLYNWYFKSRDDFDADYLDWTGKIGAKMAFYATVLQAVTGLIWLFVLPESFSFIQNPVFIIAGLFGIGLVTFLFFAQKNPIKFAIPTMALAFVTILAMSAAREFLRMDYTGQFGYSIFEYKLNLDWGSTILFLLTFVMGLVIIGYIAAVAFNSGRTTGKYTESSFMNKWGKLSISILVFWIIVVAGLGVYLTFQNYLLT